MQNEERYQVTASLFMLREMKRRQEQVNRGHALLKRKADALRLRGRQTAVELAAVQATVMEVLKDAYMSLAAVKFNNGESNALVLENIMEISEPKWQAQTKTILERKLSTNAGGATYKKFRVWNPIDEAQIKVAQIKENISGVSTDTLHPIEQTGSGDALRLAGLGSGGHSTAEAKKAFREAIKMLIKLASLRNICVLLDDAIRSTMRKVNGIEKVILPKLKNTENYIKTEMDEREREEFHRLKIVKAKKIHAKFMASKMVTDDRKQLVADIGRNMTVGFAMHACGFRRSECMMTLLHPRPPATATSTGSGEEPPSLLSHYWDDEDLLF